MRDNCGNEGVSCWVVFFETDCIINIPGLVNQQGYWGGVNEGDV